MSVEYRFLENHGRGLADILTAFRIFIILQIMFLSFFSNVKPSFNIILFWLLLGWISDEFDGRFARADQVKEPSWFGRNERKIDLLLVGSAQIYISQFSDINPYISGIIGLIGILAFLQMWQSGDADIFLQMVYITIVCGYIIIMSIIKNQDMWIVIILYLIGLVIINWGEFKGRVKYFLTIGQADFN